MTSIESVSRADYEINNGGVDPFENLVHHVTSLVLGQRSNGGFQMEEKRIIRVPELFTVEEVATALNMHRKSVYRLIKEGRLNAIRPGGSRTIFVRQCDIDAFLYGTSNKKTEHKENPPDGG